MFKQLPETESVLSSPDKKIVLPSIEGIIHFFIHCRLFLFVFLFLFGQQIPSYADCFPNPPTVTVNPPPITTGTPPITGYSPGMVVTICITFDNYSATGGNWVEGFGFNLGPGWVPGSLIGTTPPDDSPPMLPAGSGAGWIWVSTSFTNPNGTFGPGYFFDSGQNGPGNNGITEDDWGDNSTDNGPWTFCVTATVGNTPGASLSFEVTNHSDGEAGSYTNPDCNNTTTQGDPLLPPGTQVISCAFGNIANQTNILCNGQGTGSIDIDGNAGIPPYTFTMSGVNYPNGIVTGLLGGNYTMQISSTDGCTSDFPFTITEPPALILSNPIVTNLTCHGIPNGSIAVTASGGTAPYNILLNSVSYASGNINNLNAGSYILQVSDSNGCLVTSVNNPIVITQPNPLNLFLVSKDSLLCVNDTIGSFEVSGNGGTLPYTYESNPSLPNFGGIFGVTQGGMYEVVVTDANDCTGTLDVNYYQVPQPFQVTLSQVTNINCFGNNNGQIVLSPVGGYPPYSFTVSINGIAMPSLNNSTGIFNNLAPGVYDIFARDFYQCSYDFSINITQAFAPLSAEINQQTPVICFGDTTGTISVTCIGGTPPYTVSNSINTYPGNPAFFPDVFAGPDVMLVVDANQCFVTIPYVMNQPAAPLSHTISSINNITCPPSIDGTISLDVNGGWPTNNIIYNYKLFNAANNLLFDQNNNGVFGNIPEGGYYIHITDSMGCVDTVSFSIVGPDTALSISVDILNNVSCNGDSSGYVLFGANGGYPGYQYFINSNPVTNGIGNNLPPGSHVLSVTDANGCSKDTIIDITEPDLLQLNLISQDSVKCFGACNGKISIQASGGTPPYTYTLNGITSNNNGLFNQLCAGIYQVVVSDARGCTTTFNHTMFQPLAPLTALQVINDSVTCYGGSNGLLYIQASGGTPAYQYSLTGQVSGNTAANNNGVFSGLIADDYDVVATDANLCTFTNTYTIGQANLPLQLTVSGTQNVICNGDTTGHICFLAAGGTLPYSFVCLDNGLVQPEGILGSGPCFYGLNSGSYSISVTDFNGCSVTQQANITQPATPIQATASVSQVKCYSGSDGIIAVNTVGGTPGYTFAINTSPFNFSPISVFGNLPAGAYAITIRDANQCTLVLPVQVNQPLLPLSSQIVQQVPLRCNGDTNACVTIAALLNSGTQPYRYIFNNDTLTSGLICNLSPGQYSARVLDANGCVYVQDINIANPPVVEAAFVEVKNVTCFAGADGMLKAQGSGGTPGTTPAPQYIYHWPGLPGNPLLPVVNGLSAQTYSMYVEDSFGCLSDTIYATLTQPEQLRTIAVGQTDICIGNSTTLTINATGGTPGYQILWFPNGITPVPPITGSPLTVQPTTTTNYLVQVSDSKNCRSLRDTIKITVHPLPTALFTVDPPVGCQGMCVSFSDISLISSTTGDVIERSHWVYGDNTFETQTNPTHCYQDAGNYNVRLVSETNYGCKDTVTLNNVIKVNPNPQVEFTFGPQPTSLVDPKIQFQIAELENNLYYWDLGDGTITTELNPLHTYKDTGKYCVKLRQISENGCPDSLIQCVVISPNFTMFIPSAFTPNGDLINDTFTVVSEYLSDYNIVIMDRWGQLVFASSSLDNQWDGIFKGDEAAEGVYTWVIRATDVTGKTYRKNGQVSLIR